MGRKIKNARQLLCADGLRYVKQLRDTKRIYDPKLLNIGLRMFFVKRAPQGFKLSMSTLDGLVGGVMGMLAREDKERRSQKDFGIENLLFIQSLDNSDRSERRIAEYKQTLDPDIVDMPDIDAIAQARELLLKQSSEVSSDMREQDDIDFAAMLEKRAFDDITEDAQKGESNETSNERAISVEQQGFAQDTGGIAGEHNEAPEESGN